MPRAGDWQDLRMPSPTVRVVVEGSGRRIEVALGGQLLDELRAGGIALQSDCGGVGTCGECRVRFTAGVPEPTIEDWSLFETAEVEAGWRLACQARPQASCRVELPETSEEIGLRIETGAAAGEAMIRRTSAQPGATDIALAVDVGTTTVACFLVDGASGRAIDVAAFPNPQRAYGADVVSRIVHAHEQPTGLARLQSSLVEAIEVHVLELCRGHRIDPARVARMAAVGNNTMTHLLWGVDPWSLGVAPYEPVFTDVASRPGSELGFRRLTAMEVQLVPGIAGHLGADTVAGLLALGLDVDTDGAPRLLLDLGTNGEMVLVHRGRALGCSTAAGPAFEGVHISAGMPALEGAIEHVDLGAGDLRLTTIGGGEPRGLCGSGLADAVVALVRAHLLAPSGRLRPAAELDASVPATLSGRVREGAGDARCSSPTTGRRPWSSPSRTSARSSSPRPPSGRGSTTSSR